MNPKIEFPKHPCMNEKLHSKIARMHLPVAPLCNTSCGYCERGCRSSIEECQMPGVCEKIVSPAEAVNFVTPFLNKYGKNSIIGIAGPGDPLANEETFDTISLLKENFPDIRLCLCTNGLNLPDNISRLKASGIKHMSVTLNGISPEIVNKIYRYIKLDGKKVMGTDASVTLIRNQLKGIEMAVQAGLFVKVNTVVIPAINDFHLVEIAKKSADLGAGIMNIMPLIPGGMFKYYRRPTTQEMQQHYQDCGEFISVFKKCKQCRADAVGIPGEMEGKCQRTA